MVALDIEGVGSPFTRGVAVNRCVGITLVAAYGDLLIADEVIGGFLCGNAFDDDVFAIATRENKGYARTVYVVGEDIQRECVGLVVLDRDRTRRLDALCGHDLLREHKDV